MVFSHHWIDISGEKSYGWGGGVVAFRIMVSAPVPVPFLWTLDFGSGTWIWDLDFGLGFWTGLGLDKNPHKNPKYFKIIYNVLDIYNLIEFNVLCFCCVYFTKYVCNGIGPNLWNSQSNLLKRIFIEKEYVYGSSYFIELC